jgi:hypothetical protein
MTRTRRAAVALLGATLVASGPLALGAAGGAPASAAAAGPGSYVFVRSQATGKAPSAADDARCADALGFPRNLLTIERLDAVVNAPTVDPATGEITNGVAAPVSPAYLCGALGGDGALVQSYARTTFPPVGAIQVAGPCDLRPSLAQVLNPLSGAGAQTGSLIAGYFPGVPAADDGPAPAAAPKPVAGARFHVLRDGGSRTLTSSSDCPAGWRARVSTLKAARVAAATGRVAPASGPDAAALTVCYDRVATTGTVNARAVLRLSGTTLRAEGVCRHQALPGTGTALVQTCGLWLKAPLLTIRDGLITGTLLVPAGNAAGTADSGLWTAAVLGS